MLASVVHMTYYGFVIRNIVILAERSGNAIPRRNIFSPSLPGNVERPVADCPLCSIGSARFDKRRHAGEQETLQNRPSADQPTMLRMVPVRCPGLPTLLF